MTTPEEAPGFDVAHELKNAINAAVIAAVVARRCLERGQPDRALMFLRDVETACERCRQLAEAIPPG